MSGPERRWVLGGGAVLVAALVFTGVRSGGDEPAPPPPTEREARSPDRMLTAARYGANLTGTPEIVRVARDDAVWALIRHDGHSSLARVDGRQLREVPVYGVDPRELVPGFGHSSPYLAYGAGDTLGLVNREGIEEDRVVIPGEARDAGAGSARCRVVHGPAPGGAGQVGRSPRDHDAPVHDTAAAP